MMENVKQIKKSTMSWSKYDQVFTRKRQQTSDPLQLQCNLHINRRTRPNDAEATADHKIGMSIFRGKEGKRRRQPYSAPSKNDARLEKM